MQHEYMTRHEGESLLKFTVALRPCEDHVAATECLWGRWIDRKEGLVLSHNNANEVPLAVNDTVRVARVASGSWRLVEVVRLAESVVTWTSFQPPVTQAQALAVYDGWVHDGMAVHTEGGNGIMVTAWREFLSIEEVVGALTVFAAPGWELWQVFTPEERLRELDQRVDMGRGMRVQH